jgi:hypothetical protein
LLKEYQQALIARSGHVCHPGCSRCGLAC